MSEVIPESAALLADPPATTCPAVAADDVSFVPVLGTDGWLEARRLADTAKAYTRAGTAAKAMCGLVLRALREEAYGPRTGRAGRPKKGAPQTWGSLLADRVGITDECASNWMRMADAVEALALTEQQDIRDLLVKLPWDWTPEEAAALDAAVCRLTEGKTQRQLLQLEFWSDLGVAARPNTRNAAGANQHGKGVAVPATPEAMREAMEAVARQWLTGSLRFSRMEPGSLAWHMADFTQCSEDRDADPSRTLTAAALENMPAPERKRLYEDIVAPFAAAFRKFASERP